jgi:hypothetical protein
MLASSRRWGALKKGKLLYAKVAWLVKSGDADPEAVSISRYNLTSEDLALA